MSKPFVVVATPCFGGMVNQGYMLSVLKLLQLATGGEFELDVVLMGGDSLITRSRSVLVSRFLDNPRATHMMFIDADISFEPDQFLRLLRLDEDFVAGAYPLKQIDWRALPARAVAGEALWAAGLSYVGQFCTGPELRAKAGFATAKYRRHRLSTHQTQRLPEDDRGPSRTEVQGGANPDQRDAQ